MAAIATDAFLAHLESLYPKNLTECDINPWSLIAVTAFSASNIPEAIPLVFKYAIRSLETQEKRRSLVKKLKEALFKTGMLCGYPKAINAIMQLHLALPDDLKDDQMLRPIVSTEKLHNDGQKYFDALYGETAGSVQGLLREIYPDLEYFSTALAYGFVYQDTQILSAIETSFVFVAALIASDVARQIDWHQRGALRFGASIDDLQAVRAITIDVTKAAAGVNRTNPIPDILI